MLDTMKNSEHLASADALPDSSLDSFERCLSGWNQLAVERRMRGQEPAAALAVAACTVLPVQDMRIGVAYFRERADILSRLERARADVARLQAELESHLSQERCVIAAELRRLAEQFELGVNDILGEAPAPRVPNVRIPVKTAICSGSKSPAIPVEVDHLIRRKRQPSPRVCIQRGYPPVDNLVGRSRFFVVPKRSLLGQGPCSQSRLRI